MTAVALSRHRPVPVLRIEIRRSVVLWAVPLLLALFYFDSFRTAAGFPPVWTVRSSVITSHMVADFGPIAAGLAAWVASREGRRKTGDLVATTVRPAWARQASALGATLFWLLLTFLAGVAAIYGDTARQAAWGGPPLWPAAVGVVELAAFAVIGFTAGALFPGRFTAPLAAIGTFLLAEIGFHAALQMNVKGSTYPLLSTATAVPLGDDGVFYRVAPDLSITQVLFMGGITVALLGVLTLAPVFRLSYRGLLSAVSRAGRCLFVAGIVLLAAGVAAAGTAYALAGTAKLSVSGWAIPALHDAASDQPVPYTPDCAGTSFQVCVHPAFGGYLAAANAALQPAAAQIAGLPGAPVRAEQVPSGEGVRAAQGLLLGGLAQTGLAGTPPVYRFTSEDGLAPFFGSPAGADNAGWRAGFQQAFLTAFAAGSPHTGPGPDAAVLSPTAAQQAVITALMTVVGSPAPQFGEDMTNGQPTAGATPAQIAAAAQRFASLSPAARHAWLAAHLPALRAGAIILAQLP
jgi:ABC-type transport system involved in multi-copper enzyme maturation permease subunit